MALNRKKINDLINGLSIEVAGTVHEPYLDEMRLRYEFLLRRTGENLPSGRVLDVGASPGIFTLLMIRAGYDTVGLDLFPHKRFPSASGKNEINLFIEKGIPVVGADVAASPFPMADSAFDAVMMNETIEHLSCSPLPCLKEICRTLKPGGLLFLSTPNVVSLANRIRFLAGRNIYTRIEALVNVAPYKLHSREYAMYELEDILGRAGFRVIEKQWLNLGGAPAHKIRKFARSIYYASTALFPRGRSNLFIISEKK
jgi:SAM-dependent methyltransferase